MNKKVIRLIGAVLCLLLSFSMFACKTSNGGSEEGLLTLTLETNGGGDVVVVKVKEGANISNYLSTPVKDFYKFEGWFSDETTTTAYTATTMPSTDLTLYAKWSPISVYVIRFDTQGGSTIANKTITAGERLTLPSSPSRPLYTFSGWFEDKACSDDKAFVPANPPGKSMTLYAKWIVSTSAASVRFYGNGDLLMETVVELGKPVSRPSLLGSDFEYSRWYIGDDKNAYYDFSDPVDVDILNLNIDYSTKGITYDLSGKVTGYNGTSTTVVFKPGAEIAPYAFYGNTKIASVKISNISTIPAFAFYGCTALKEISLGSSVTTIGEGAFFNCIRLSGFTLPAGIENIGSKAFLGCGSIKNITFPATLLTMGEYAFADSGIQTANLAGTRLQTLSAGVFSNCTSLTSVTFPTNNTFTTIGARALFNSRITSLNITEHLTTIGAEAFARCIAIKSLTKDGNNNNFDVDNGSLYNNGKTTLMLCLSQNADFIAPTTLTTIEKNALYGNDKIRTIKIQSSNVALRGAFEGVNNLTTLTLVDFGVENGSVPEMFGAPSGDANVEGNKFTPDTLVSITVNGSVSSIPNFAFYGCNNVNSITITNNDNVTSMGNYAYANTGITTLTIGQRLADVGENIFAGCTSLENVSVHGSNTNFTTDATNGCVYYKINATDLRLLKAYGNKETVVVNSNTVIIDNFAFYKYGSNLKYLTLPFIGEKAEYLTAAPVPVAEEDFNVSMGYSTYKAYYEAHISQTENPGASYKQNLAAIRGETSYFSYIFGCNNTELSAMFAPNLTQLTISGELEIIPFGAFYDCNIEYFDITASETTLKYYGDWAFAEIGDKDRNAYLMKGFIKDGTIAAANLYDKANLTPLYDEGTVEILGEYTFSNAYMNFDEITLKTNIKEIGEGVFLANYFRHIDIQAYLTTIPSRAFYMNTAIIGYNPNAYVQERNPYTSASSIITLTEDEQRNGVETTIKIPNTVKTIGYAAFSNYDYMFTYLDYSLNGNLKVDFVDVSAAAIAAAAVPSDYVFGLEEFPNSSTMITNSAFGYSGLRTFELPNTVTSLGARLFQYCPLDEFTFEANSTLREIQMYAFYNTVLKGTFELPSTVYSIASYAFMLERELYKLTLPASPLHTFSIGNAIEGSVFSYVMFDSFRNRINLRSLYIYKKVVKDLTEEQEEDIKVHQDEYDKLLDEYNKIDNSTEEGVAERNELYYKMQDELTAIQLIKDEFGIPRIIRPQDKTNPFRGTNKEFTIFVPSDASSIYASDTTNNWNMFRIIPMENPPAATI